MAYDAVSDLDFQLRTVLKMVAALEHKFHPTRKWRADLAFLLPPKLLIEIDGGVFIQGRHSRGAGILKDNEKLNEAAILGFRVLRFTPQQVKSGAALTAVERFFQLGVRAG